MVPMGLFSMYFFSTRARMVLFTEFMLLSRRIEHRFLRLGEYRCSNWKSRMIVRTACWWGVRSSTSSFGQSAEQPRKVVFDDLCKRATVFLHKLPILALFLLCDANAYVWHGPKYIRDMGPVNVECIDRCIYTAMMVALPTSLA